MYKKKHCFSLSFLLLLSLIATSVSGQIDTSGVKKLFEMDLSDLMNQKVVTASKYEQNSSEAASSIGVITSEEIKQYVYRTLGEALNSQRGMFASNDKNYTYVGSRGFGRPTDYNNRIVIMVDGHIMNEVVYGSGFMGNELGINLDNIEKIEIIRGPGGSVYGSGAMLNTVNLILKKGAETDGVTVSAGTGSYGKNDLSAIYGKKIKSTDISVSGIGGLYNGENYYFSELDAPATNYGQSVNRDWEKYIGLQTNLSNNNFKLSASYNYRAKGIPTGAFNTDLNGDVESTDERFFIESSYRKDIRKNSSLLFRLYFDGYKYAGSYPEDGIDSFDKTDGRWWGSELQYYLEAGKRNIITAGIEYKYVARADYRQWNNDTTFYYNNFPYSSFSVYTQDQIKLANNLNLTIGLRFDQYSKFGHSASPRVALVYKYSKSSSLKLLYGEAFRIPNFYESFYESVNSQKSNPDIRSERIRTAEFDWLHEITGSVFGNFSVYRFLINNLIDQIIDENDGLIVYRNIGKATGTGAEYELRYENPGNKSQAFLNFTLQRTIDDNTKEILSNSPEFIVKSGVVLNISKYFNVVPELFYETGRKTLGGNKTADVYLLNLGINSGTFLKHFSASLKARNLLNRKYYYPGGYEHVQDVLVQDSRNIYLKLTAHF
jgi:outer membrane receptor for ferrienterochelin and colicins